MSEIAIQKMKDNAPNRSGENNPFYARNHTESTKQLMSYKRKEVYYNKTEEERRKEYDSRRGKKESPELRKQKSDKMKKLFESEPERRNIIFKRNKGMKSPIKGKHKVYDDKELNIFHYE